MTTIRFGTQGEIELDASSKAVCAVADLPYGETIEDIGATLTDALKSPTEYPPLSLCTTPTDMVVLALDDNVPQAPQIIASVVIELVEADVNPDGIKVLTPRADSYDEDPRRLIPKDIREYIGIEVHDPHHRERLAFFAANDAGDPILVNRTIHDADLVLPIGCIREASADYFGIHTPIFPTYSDEKTLSRFRSPAVLDPTSGHRDKLLEEVGNVAWQVGITFTIQLVPGIADDVLHVVAGEAGAVEQRGLELYREAWSWSSATRADLVIVTIEGGAHQQTWQNVGQAIEATKPLLNEDAAVAICCELADPPDPGVQRLIGAHSRDAVMRKVRKERPVDAVAAAQLAGALERGRVYLLSGLDPELVEDLDMVYVSEESEVTRLAQRHGLCIVLPNAALAMVRVDG